MSWSPHISSFDFVNAEPWCIPGNKDHTRFTNALQNVSKFYYNYLNSP